jgi:hypothetical protein
MAARLSRINPVTVNDVLDGRKLLEIDCADRVYLSLTVPNLIVGGQVVSFLTQHEGKPVPSPAHRSSVPLSTSSRCPLCLSYTVNLQSRCAAWVLACLRGPVAAPPV